MAYVIIDDVLAPKGGIVIEYRGVNPFSVYPKLSSLLQVIFQGKGENFFEDEFRWDITTDPREFFVRIHFDKKIDKFTRMNIGVKLHGKQPVDETKPGIVFIELTGSIKTSFPTDTLVEKILVLPFVWLYYHTIYKNIRRRYIERCKEGIEKLEGEIRRGFGLVVRERLT